MYTENYKTLLKAFRDRNKWKDILCSWIGRLYCLTVPTIQNNLQIQCDPSPNPNDFFFFFYKNRKKSLNSYGSQGTQNSQNNLENEGNIISAIFLNCLFYQVLVVACGIKFPEQGSNLGPLHWEHGILAIGPTGKSRLVQF